MRPKVSEMGKAGKAFWKTASSRMVPVNPFKEEEKKKEEFSRSGESSRVIRGCYG